MDLPDKRCNLHLGCVSERRKDKGHFGKPSDRRIRGLEV